MSYDDRDRVIAWLADGHGDKLTTLDRAVLTTIAQYVNSQTGLSWRGVDYLATVWGVDTRSIKRSITRLHQLGYLETAERGTGQRRARYRLAGELINTGVGGHSGHPTQTEVGGPKQQSRGTETTKKGDLGVTRISKSSRSYSGEMTIDGATHRAPLGSPGAAPTVVEQIREKLSLTAVEADRWIEGCLAGRQVSNVDAYLLKCLANHVADTAKAAATRGSAKKTAAKKATPAKKGAAKLSAGKFTCPRCGRDFPTARSLSSHNSHCATVQCPVCNATVKARDLSDHRVRRHAPAQKATAPAPQPPRPTFDMHDWQTEYNAGKTKLGLNDWLIEKSRSAKRATAPTKPKKDPKPCQGCNRPLTGWAAIQTPSYCAGCTKERLANLGRNQA